MIIPFDIVYVSSVIVLCVKVINDYFVIAFSSYIKQTCTCDKYSPANIITIGAQNNLE